MLRRNLIAIQIRLSDDERIPERIQALLAEMAAQRALLGYGRADAWINIARVGLLLDDAALAADALGRLQADPGLQLDRDVLLASRVAQLAGELARLQGDLPRSQALLRQRLQAFERPGADRQVLPAWVATLDLAYTQLLLDDAQAGATLTQAAARRPPGIPAGHALDADQAYLHARLATGQADGAATLQALDALRRARHRRPGPPSGAGLGSLGGAFI